MGPLEVVLILIVVLIVWGPGKIPETARTLGKAMRTFRKATSDLTATVTRELDLEQKDSTPQLETNGDDDTKESPATDETESNDAETSSPRDQ